MLHAADVEAIQELKKKVEQEALKWRELEKQETKTSSLLQDKITAWNIVEKQLKVGSLYRKVGGKCKGWHTINCRAAVD